MTLAKLNSLIAEYLTGKNADGLVSLMPRLTLFKSVKTTTLEAVIYDPVACLILQGAKEITSGNRILSFGVGESLIVSHTVPVISRITKASYKSPYVALILDIDLELLRALYHEIEAISVDEVQMTALNVEETGEDLLSAIERYLKLAKEPLEAKVIGPLVLKEIHFRLLMAPHGKMLRKLLERESCESQIYRAISHLKDNFRNPLSVPMLAKISCMSESSFYSHFKKITETTPVQFQKEMRLIEARRLIRNGGASISSVAFAVGYVSPTQFSREYTRKFGYSPRSERQ